MNCKHLQDMIRNKKKVTETLQISIIIFAKEKYNESFTTSESKI